MPYVIARTDDAASRRSAARRPWWTVIAMKPLQGTRALVTGASRGIGRAVAEAYAAEGAEVAVTATDLMHLDSVVRACEAAGTPVHPFALDLADPAAPSRVGAAILARLGGLDVLVNNAGLLGVKGPLADSPPDVFEKVLTVSVVGPLRLLQAVLPGMSDGGAIINVTSGAAGRAGWGGYAVSRLAINGMTTMLRTELEDRGIRAMAINPGPARTTMRAEAYPEEDPQTVPAPGSLVGPFVSAARGEDLGPDVVSASQWVASA